MDQVAAPLHVLQANIITQIHAKLSIAHLHHTSQLIDVSMVEIINATSDTFGTVINVFITQSHVLKVQFGIQPH